MKPRTDKTTRNIYAALLIFALYGLVFVEQKYNLGIFDFMERHKILLMLLFVIGVYWYSKHLNKTDDIRRFASKNLSKLGRERTVTQLREQGHDDEEIRDTLQKYEIENTDVFAYFKQKANLKRFVLFISTLFVLSLVHNFITKLFSITVSSLIYIVVLVPIGAYLMIRLDLRNKLHDSMMKAGLLTLVPVAILALFAFFILMRFIEATKGFVNSI